MQVPLQLPSPEVWAGQGDLLPESIVERRGRTTMIQAEPPHQWQGHIESLKLKGYDEKASPKPTAQMSGVSYKTPASTLENGHQKLGQCGKVSQSRGT